jgi:hypothetical protein
MMKIMGSETRYCIATAPCPQKLNLPWGQKQQKKSQAGIPLGSSSLKAENSLFRILMVDIAF